MNGKPGFWEVQRRQSRLFSPQALQVWCSRSGCPCQVLQQSRENKSHRFHIITISTDGSERTFALGGLDGSSRLDSVEELDPDTLTWNTTPAKLAEKRNVFGAVALPRSLVCQAWGGLELWEDVYFCSWLSHVGIWICLLLAKESILKKIMKNSSQLKIYHYANLKILSWKKSVLMCMEFYQKSSKIWKALEINLRVCHCLSSGFLRYTYYDFKEKPILLLQL